MTAAETREDKKRIRKIIHIDLDAFFCAVEELLDPSLAGKAFAVGGAAGERGVISSCSYPARRFGVHSAMPTGQALRLCPELILVHGHYAEYQKASRKTMEILEDMTPLVEQISIDEAFLDMTDLPESGRVIALYIQSMVKTKVGLPCSLGVASNKLVAKIANNRGKSENRTGSPPCAIKVIPPSEEAAFLAPLPVDELWGIGPKTAAHLNKLGITTIGDLAAQADAWLDTHFGDYGHSLSRHARGIDHREVVNFHDTKSISNEVTFSQDVHDEQELHATLRRLSDKVGSRLREDRFLASTVRIKIRWPDFSTFTRQVTLDEPFDQDSIIFEAALGLFNGIWQKDQPVRLLGVGAGNLQAFAVQMNLWETRSDRERRLLKAVDEIRDRFGKDVIQRGTRLTKKSTPKE
ncbi:MAG: DNA polymerase IV [Chloroflexi bacterium]|nr:DNA polymerase IV [Chloroflexota bacterium]